MLTDRQRHLIKQAKELGYGYERFAMNVEGQGWCSPKQETSLDNMVSAGTYRKNNWNQKKYYTRSRSSLEWDDYHWGDFDSTCASEDFWL